MKRNILSNFILCLTFIISGVFGIGSAVLLFFPHPKETIISANSTYNTEESDIRSIKNITFDNVSEKLESLESIDNKQLTYSEELSSLNENDSYFDKDGSIYVYDNQDNLISYMLEEDTADNSDKISESTAVTYASNYLPQFTDDIDRYTLQDIRYDNNCNTYSIVYGNQINGIRTTDIIYLIIACDGTLVGYSAQNLGAFNNVTISSHQLNSAKTQAIELAKEQFGESLSNEKVSDIVLSKPNEDNVLYVSVNGTVTKNDYTYELDETYTILFNSL